MTDSNLVGTSFAGTNTKDLELQLYIESVMVKKLRNWRRKHKGKRNTSSGNIKLVKGRQNMKMVSIC